MIDDDDFRPRLGKAKPRQPKRFVAQVLLAARLGTSVGGVLGRRRQRYRVSPGRGAIAAWRATSRLLGDRGRRVVVKARFVRQHAGAGRLAAHLTYLRREGVTRDGAPARMFDATSDEADVRAFAERARDDRLHFRFIVSPEDAGELTDLHAFTRDLVSEMEHDLGTKLDWVALDHWNTDNPHVHLIVRGVADDGSDLFIHRDYISRGIRARAEHLVALELGPRSEHAIRDGLTRDVGADRWTRLDTALKRDAGQHGIVDLRPEAGQQPDGFLRSLMIGRLEKLERLGLARRLGPAQWMLVDEAEPRLRELSIRGDIIKTMHRAMTEAGVERSVGDFAIDDPKTSRVTGRVLEKGLDDELAGRPYLVIDGIDGRAHYVRLMSLSTVEDVRTGSIVSVGPASAGDKDQHTGRKQVALRMLSRRSLEDQIRVDGATWLDRELVAREKTRLAPRGFGGAVRDALERRTDYLVERGLAQRRGNRIVLAQDLLGTLTRRELARVGQQIATETGLEHRVLKDGDRFEGVYRRHADLVSGRFALIDDSKQFVLVPWRPSIERELGRDVAGVVRAGGGISWAVGRERGIAH